MIVQKKTSIPVHAVRLGTNNKEEMGLLRQRQLQRTGKDRYEVFTREARIKGEIAQNGDYFKFDTEGNPYPVEKKYFEKNHVPTDRENYYYQIQRRLSAWSLAEPLCEPLRFLLDTKKLRIDPECKEYFSAYLWGTEQTAPADTVIIFDSIVRSFTGELENVEFHFVVKEEFEKTYEEVRNS